MSTEQRINDTEHGRHHPSQLDIGSGSNERKKWFARWAARSVEFATYQGLVQLLAAVSGILIIRYLDKSNYAMYAVAFQMQTACTLMSDVGIGLGVRSIGARVCSNPQQHASLIKTAIQLKTYYTVASLCIYVPITVWMLRKIDASWPSAVSLAVLVGLGAGISAAFTVYSSVPLLRGSYKWFQRRDLASALGRFFSIATLAFTYINALLAITVAVISTYFQLLFTRSKAERTIGIAKLPDPVFRKEIISLSIKQFPNTLFFSLQGQIVIFLLALFGDSEQMANYTAIGRVAAILTILQVVVANLWSPRFAQLNELPRIARLYLAVIFLVSLFVLPIICLSIFFPKLLLSILGPQYYDVEQYLFAILLVSLIKMISRVMVTLNHSRGWITWNSILYIPATVLAQVAVLVSVDVTTFSGVISFAMVTAAVRPPILLIDFVYGLRQLKHRSNPVSD